MSYDSYPPIPPCHPALEEAARLAGLEMDRRAHAALKVSRATVVANEAGRFYDSLPGYGGDRDCFIANQVNEDEIKNYW